MLSAGPSSAVKVTGWKEGGVPSAGDAVNEVENEKRANEVVRQVLGEQEITHLCIHFVFFL